MKQNVIEVMMKSKSLCILGLAAILSLGLIACGQEDDTKKVIKLDKEELRQIRNDAEIMMNEKAEEINQATEGMADGVSDAGLEMENGLDKAEYDLQTEMKKNAKKMQDKVDQNELLPDELDD